MPAFGQEQDAFDGNRRMAVTVNPFPILYAPVYDGYGVDLAYEYAILPAASIRFAFSYASIDLDPGNLTLDNDEATAILLNAGVTGRWYWQEKYVEGWFVSGGFQFQLGNPNSNALFEDPLDLDDDEWIYAFSAYPGVGFKWIFPSKYRVAFSVEAMASIGFLITSTMSRSQQMDLPATWLLGTTGPRTSLYLGISF